MMAEAPEGAESEVTPGRKEAGSLSASEVACQVSSRSHKLCFHSLTSGVSVTQSHVAILVAAFKFYYVFGGPCSSKYKIKLQPPWVC